MWMIIIRTQRLIIKLRHSDNIRRQRKSEEYKKGEGYNQTDYTYYSDRIEMQATNYGGEDISDTYYLDADGRVTNTKKYKYAFTYNTDGYMTTFQSPMSINDEVVGYISYTLEYQDGNLVKISTPAEVERKLMTLSYYDSAYQNMLGYNSPFYLAGILGDRNTFYLSKQGCFGKESKNLLKSIDLHSPYSTFSNIQYIYDAQGRINSMAGGLHLFTNVRKPVFA